MVILVNHSVPEEGIHHSEPYVAVNIKDTEIGTGTLYITESSVLWLNSRDEGIQLEYKQINLHAISRDLQSFPKEHLLCHYEGKIPGVEGSDEELSDEDNERDNESACQLIEIRFIPENKESLDAMFDALADCQTLHPDSDCQLSEDEFENADEEGGGDGFYSSEVDMAHLSEQGLATLERLNQLLFVGQGDSEIAARTGNITLSNGHQSSDQRTEDDQFNDAEDMNE